jgi:hypothetical protein
MCQHSHYTGVRNPGIVTIRRPLESDVPTLALHRYKESWNRYHPEEVWNEMCQHLHSTGKRNPGIVTIRRIFGTRCANTRTTWDKWGICWELPPHGSGIHRRKGIPPGITSSQTRNPPEGGNSTGNYKLIYADSGR